MTSNAEWNHTTTGTEVAFHLAENIKGRVVLVTGVSPESLGGTAAVAIARHDPARLILASRTLSKLESVAAQIRKEASGVTTDLVELDLASFAAIRESADKINALVDRIDVLIHSAAVVSSDRRETADGLESQIGVNHFGPFLLTSLLISKLKAAAANGKSGATRIINTSSLGYRLSPFRFHDYNFEGKEIPAEEQPLTSVPHYMKQVPEQGRNYHVFCAYGQSKTAEILHAVALDQKYRHKGIRAFALHPGSIWTGLSRSLSPEDHAFIKNGTSDNWKNHDQGIATTIVAAFDPRIVEQTDHIYLSDCQLTDVAPYAKDAEIAKRLWQLSEEIVGMDAKL